MLHSQTSFYTSAEVARKNEEGSVSRGRKYYEANIRSVIAFREIGKGHAGMENFARVMNINCLSSKAYKKMKDDICEAYETVAENSMKNAAKEVHDKYKEKLSSDETITLCDCSLDGTWQKRGHSSLNGVVTAIVDGKCIDKHVMSKFCKGCSSWENKKGTPSYENWALEHNCSAIITASHLEQWRALVLLQFIPHLLQSTALFIKITLVMGTLLLIKKL